MGLENEKDGVRKKKSWGEREREGIGKERIREEVRERESH